MANRPSSGQLEVHRTHDLVVNASELLALCGLGPKIPEHRVSWTPFHCQVSFLDPVSHKEITDVNVLHSLAAGSLRACPHYFFCIVQIKLLT
jgi:hypothetical protein